MERVLLQGGEQALSPLSCLSCFVARIRGIWCWKGASSAIALGRIWQLNFLKLPLEAMAAVLEKHGFK